MTNSSVTPTQGSSSTTPVATTAASSGASSSGAFSASSTISTMDDLKNNAPQLYQQLLMSIAEQMKYEQDQMEQNAQQREAEEESD